MRNPEMLGTEKGLKAEFQSCFHDKLLSLWASRSSPHRLGETMSIKVLTLLMLNIQLSLPWPWAWHWNACWLNWRTAEKGAGTIPRKRKCAESAGGIFLVNTQGAAPNLCYRFPRTRPWRKAAHGQTPVRATICGVLTGCQHYFISP